MIGRHNAYATDLDGRPRIVSGTADIGKRRYTCSTLSRPPTTLRMASKCGSRQVTVNPVLCNSSFLFIAQKPLLK